MPLWQHLGSSSHHSRPVLIDDPVLHPRDDLEGLLQDPLLQVAQPARVDEIVRLLAAIELLHLVMDPEQGDDLEGLGQFVADRIHGRVLALHGLDALQRRGLLHPGLEREQPDNVHQRPDAPQLQVQLVLVLAVLLDEEGLEESEGRPVLGDGCRHLGKEQVAAGQLGGQVLTQFLCQLFTAKERTKIEKDQGPEDRFRRRVRDPGGKIVLPCFERLAPPRIARHIVGRAEGKAALDQAVPYKDRVLGEIGFRPLLLLRRSRVRVDDGIVLVRLEGLLLAAFAAEGYPAERHRRAPHLLFRDLEHFADHAVVQFRYDPGDVAGLCAFLQQEPHHPVDLHGHRNKPFDALLAFQVLGEGQGRRALEQHEVVVREDPLEMTLLDHKDVVDIVLDHLEHGFEAVIPHIDAHQGKGHDVPDRIAHAPRARHDLLAQVPVRHDAHGKLRSCPRRPGN